MDKKFKFSADKIKDLIPHMGGCYASDMVVVEGKKVEKNICVPSQVIIRQSCGCNNKISSVPKIRNKKLNENLEFNTMIDNFFMNSNGFKESLNEIKNTCVADFDDGFIDARRARVSGTVILQAVIGETGDVESITILRSRPLLDESAVAAVRQWKYRPAIAAGEAVRVYFTVTVDFRLR